MHITPPILAYARFNFITMADMLTRQPPEILTLIISEVC